jgi:hypothetical protein
MVMTNRIGEVFVSNEGCKGKIIAYRNNLDCDIKFLDKNGAILLNRAYGDIVRGKFRNPYRKSVYGVGFLGEGPYVAKNTCKIYNSWKNMLQRCYSKEYHSRNPTYIGCSVDERWRNFQNFAAWFESNSTEGFDLDKDILFRGNKVYSPETCLFLPKQINYILLKSGKKRGNHPLGVSKDRKKFAAHVSIGKKNIQYLGSYDTEKEAFQAYKIAKESYIKEAADKWKDEIDPRAHESLYRYEVEITF